MQSNGFCFYSVHFQKWEITMLMFRGVCLSFIARCQALELNVRIVGPSQILVARETYVAYTLCGIVWHMFTCVAHASCYHKIGEKKADK